jgi:hypothetical protein
MFVYLLKVQNENIFKIGITKKLSSRKLQLQTGNPFTIELVNFYESDYARKIEKFLHTKYSYTKLTEGFDKLSGEWFILNEKDVLSFKDDCTRLEESFKILKEVENPFFK